MVDRRWVHKHWHGVVAISLVIVGLLVALVVYQQKPSQGCDWFTQEVTGGPEFEPGPGVWGHRLRRFDADDAVRALVSDESLGLAVPGQRVVVPSRCNPTITLFDDQVLEVIVDELALMSLPKETKPGLELLGTAMLNGKPVSSIVFVFGLLGDHYTFDGTVNNLNSSLIHLSTHRPEERTVSLLGIGPWQLQFGSERTIIPGNSTAKTDSDDNAGVVTGNSSESVDVLFGYADTAGGPSSGTSWRTVIRKMVADGNGALFASSVSVRLNLVGIEAIDLVETEDSFETHLEQLRTGTGSFEPLHELREEFAADLVHVVVPWMYQDCSAAYSTTPQGTPDYAFGISSADCAEQFSGVHALGLNLGAGTISKEDAQTLPFDFSKGHAAKTGQCSIMSPACSFEDLECNRLLQFSNPIVDFIAYPGLASGTKQANNAQSLNQMANVIVNYR